MTWKPGGTTWAGHLSPIHPDGLVDPLDLAMLLGRTRRFGNNGSLEWSVLHHSFLVVMIWLRAGFPRGELYVPLMHDAHKAYVGDVVSPVKQAVRERANGNDGLRDLEGELDDRIRRFFSSTEPDLEIEPPTLEQRRKLKLCDWAAVVVEAKLFGAVGASCLDDLQTEVRDEVMAIVDVSFPELDRVLAAHGREQL